MDDGKRVLSAMHKLLSVFLILDSPLSREYQRALTASIHLWEWMRETNHPGWQIFCQNASSFNEESGEIAFSVLARDIASSGIRSDVKSVSRKFGLIKAKIMVAKGMEVDLCGEGFSTHDHCVILETSPDVAAAVAFFKRLVRNLLHSSHHHYGPGCGFLDAKDRRNAAPRRLVAAEVTPALSLKTASSRLDNVIAGLKVKFNQFWVYPHRDVWPAAQPEPLFDSTDGSSGDDSGAESASSQSQRDRHRSKRRRPNEPSDDDGDSGDDDSYVGRVVACPSWVIGDRWSTERYGGKRARNKARLHGTLSASDRVGNFRCVFFNDRLPDLNLTVAQVQRYVVAVDDENRVQDTPFVNPDESSDSQDPAQ